MSFNYDEIISYIENAQVFGSKLGLDNIRYLLDVLGNPQNSLKFIHVAGTNGKGSTSSFISSILTKAGLRTGLYTSPHIVSFNERMHINGVKIDEAGVVHAGNIVLNAIGEMTARGMECPTEFEITTAMAFVYFLEQKCDLVVLEVGLGGRLDCTNIIKRPLAAVITTIDFDHTKELGNTLQKITFEKAGIIKDGGRVVSYKQSPESEDELVRICNERNADLTVADFDKIRDISFWLRDESPVFQSFNYGKYGDIKLKMLGKHQVFNAVAAITAIEALIGEGYNITEKMIKDGLYDAFWTGRFEVVMTNPAVVVDGAHNPQGTANLADNLKTYFAGKKMVFVLGVLADKCYDDMLEPVLPLGDRFYTVTPFNERALDAQELAKILREKGKSASPFANLQEALDESIRNIGENEVICCFGSLYYIGKAREMLKK